MRMVVVVTSRVLTTRHHHLVAFYFLGLVGDDISLSLLRHYVADVTFLRLDIIRNLVRLVAVVAFFEHRPAFPFVIDTVINPSCVNLARVYIHADVVGRQLHLLILQLTFSMQISRSVRHHHHRVRRLVMYRCRQRTLFLLLLRLLYAIRCQRIPCYTIRR